MGVATGRSDPKTDGAHRIEAIKVLTQKLLPQLKTVATSEDIDRGAVATEIVEACKPAALPHFVVNEDVQVKAVKAILAPRQIFGAVTWTTFLKLIVRKLPGGKHFLSMRGYGSWVSYHDVYARSLVHESDIVVYLLLLLVTLDNKLVQQFIASSRHFDAFLEIQKTVTVLIMKDKEAIDSLGDMGASEFQDETLNAALETFTLSQSRKDKKIPSADEDVSIDEGQPEVEATAIDDAVMRNMLLNL